MIFSWWQILTDMSQFTTKTLVPLNRLITTKGMSLKIFKIMTPAQILKDSARQEVLHKKCSNAELIMVRIFLYSDRIRSVEEV